MKKECKKCEHNWLPRIEEDPQQCPRCKSYKWKEDIEDGKVRPKYI